MGSYSEQTTLDPKAMEFTPTATNHIPMLSTTPTRSLLLTPVPFTTESALRTDLHPFGDVRALQMDHLRHGIVTVHFYDLRHAQAAFAAIRTTYMFFSHHHPQFYYYYYPAASVQPAGLIAGHAVWAHYVVPTSISAHNQGTLVVFNLDPHVSPHDLRRVFEPFGSIKELRGTPWKKKQRFVEFFDTRDAENALKEMNGKEIHGKSVAIEFSRPGGQGRRNKLFHHSAPPTSFYKKPLFYSSPPPPPPRFYPCHSAIPPRLRSPQPPRFGRKKSSSTKQQQQLPRRSKHWKGKPGMKHEARFLIKEDEIVESDCRTTVMIKNIPNKYSQELLLNMLDKHCIHCNDQIGDSDNEQPRSSYDFVYLPIDFNNRCNVGYGFVNMTSPEAVLRLYKAFHLQQWEIFNSKKICQVTYARVQGLEALKEHFKNSKFPCEMMEQYYYKVLPVVFSPPRDGKEVLTEPLPIVGNKLHKEKTMMIISVPIGDETGNGDGGDVATSSSSKKSGGGMGGDDDDNEARNVQHLVITTVN